MNSIAQLVSASSIFDAVRPNECPRGELIGWGHGPPGTNAYGGSGSVGSELIRLQISIRLHELRWLARSRRSITPIFLNETLPTDEIATARPDQRGRLTRKLLAFAPRLKQLAESGWVRSLDEVVPAVTCTAQASILTGRLPQEHGIVGNGWLFRDTGEVRFWQQSNALIQAEPIYVTARRLAIERGLPFRAAKLFWWFNQGAAVEISVTPKPHYGADGNKVFGIAGTPEGLCERLERDLGRFPFHTFWGPKRRASLHASGSPTAPPRFSRTSGPS